MKFDVIGASAGVDISVQYQYKKNDKKSWSTATAQLRDAVTEKAMIEALKLKNRDCTIRILAADPGEDKVLVVRYKMLNKDNKWETHKTVLTNALTMSMAKNQIFAKNQDAKVRILSMREKKK